MRLWNKPTTICTTPNQILLSDYALVHLQVYWDRMPHIHWILSVVGCRQRDWCCLMSLIRPLLEHWNMSLRLRDWGDSIKVFQWTGLKDQLQWVWVLMCMTICWSSYSSSVCLVTQSSSWNVCIVYDILLLYCLSCRTWTIFCGKSIVLSPGFWYVSHSKLYENLGTMLVKYS